MPCDVYYAINDASLLIPTDNENTIFLQYFTVFLQYWLKPHILVAKELSKNHRKDASDVSVQCFRNRCVMFTVCMQKGFSLVTVQPHWPPVDGAEVLYNMERFKREEPVTAPHLAT